MISEISAFWKSWGPFCCCSVTEARLTLCNPVALPGSSVHGSPRQESWFRHFRISAAQDWARVSHAGCRVFAPQPLGSPGEFLSSRPFWSFFLGVSGRGIRGRQELPKSKLFLGKGVFHFTKSSQTFKDPSSERRLFCSLTRSWLESLFLNRLQPIIAGGSFKGKGWPQHKRRHPDAGFTDRHSD